MSTNLRHLCSRSVLLLLSVAAVSLIVAGCGSSSRNAYTNEGAVRDTARAEGIYKKAMDVIGSDPVAAEKLLRETLQYDLYHGRAHNNLGVVLFGAGKLYEAAGEFEWARKLMPGLPEPRVNLALVLDRGGRSQEALEAAQSALEVQADDIPANQAMVLIQLSNGTGDATTLKRLQNIIDRSDDQQWVAWAEVEKAKLAARLDP